MCVASNNRCNNCFIFLSCFLFTSFLLYIYFYFCHLFIFFYLCVSTKILTIIKMYSNTYKTGCAFINNCCWCQIWPVENSLLTSCCHQSWGGWIIGLMSVRLGWGGWGYLLYFLAFSLSFSIWAYTVLVNKCLLLFVKTTVAIIFTGYEQNDNFFVLTWAQ